MIKTIWNRRTEIILYLMFMVLMIGVLKYKENYHIDELLSYGLSNGKGNFSVTTGVKMEPANSVFIDYLASDGTINLRNVWENQKHDTHPPLYYLILHLICVFHPYSVSMRYAGYINIFFALLTLFFVRKICKLLTQSDEITTLISVAFILSAGILSAVSFLRMYIMAMAFVTVITYLLLNDIDRKLSVKKCFLLGVVTILGALTHYYFIVYAVFISIACGVYFLVKKRWNTVARFCVTMGCAGVISYLIFPEMINHMFSGLRGSESIENLKNLSDYGERLKTFFTIIDGEIFGGILKYILWIIGILLLWCLLSHGGIKKVCCMFKELKIAEENSEILKIRYLIVIVPLIMYYLCVSKMAVYQSNRYMYPIYAVLFSVVLCGVYIIFHYAFGGKKAALLFCVIISLLTCGSWSYNTWDYCGKSSAQGLREADKYENYDCLCIFDDDWMILLSYQELSKYKSVTFLRDGEIEKNDLAGLDDQNGFIVLLSGFDNEKYLELLKEMYPDLTSCKTIMNYGYGTSYLFGRS